MVENGSSSTGKLMFLVVGRVKVVVEKVVVVVEEAMVGKRDVEKKVVGVEVVEECWTGD